MLFAAGKRPTRAALRDFAASQRAVSLTYDPIDDDYLQLVDAGQNDPKEPTAGSLQRNLSERVWVELLREGLTFDLTGLAPGPQSEFPSIEHRFDMEKTPNGFRCEAVLLSPGQHLSGGQRTLPVIKGLIGLARDLTVHFKAVESIVWPASMSAIGPRFFESVATAWLEGGPFPALGLTAFRETSDGALQSVGLAFWTGQELRIEEPLMRDKISATRLGVRLINQLVILGTLKRDERIMAPDGSHLLLQPSENGKYVRVWPS